MPKGAVIEGDGNYRQRNASAPGDITAYVGSIERNGRHIDYSFGPLASPSAMGLAVKSARTLYPTCAERAAAPPEHPQPDASDSLPFLPGT